MHGAVAGAVVVSVAGASRNVAGGVAGGVAPRQLPDSGAALEGRIALVKETTGRVAHSEDTLVDFHVRAWWDWDPIHS